MAIRAPRLSAEGSLGDFGCSCFDGLSTNGCEAGRAGFIARCGQGARTGSGNRQTRSGQDSIWPRSTRPEILQTSFLAPCRVEISRCKPAFEASANGRPFVIEYRQPRGIAVFAFLDHVLAEDAFVGEPETPRRAHRRLVPRVAFPLEAAVTELFEDVTCMEKQRF